jgi:hypothetical protein
VALETRAALAEQLSALLRDIDAAIRARLPESGRPETARRSENAQHDEGRGGVVAAALRWLTRASGDEPTSRRARPARARSRRTRS